MLYYWPRFANWPVFHRPGRYFTGPAGKFAFRPVTGKGQEKAGKWEDKVAKAGIFGKTEPVKPVFSCDLLNTFFCPSICKYLSFFCSSVWLFMYVRLVFSLARVGIPTEN